MDLKSFPQDAKQSLVFSLVGECRSWFPGLPFPPLKTLHPQQMLEPPVWEKWLPGSLFWPARLSCLPLASFLQGILFEAESSCFSVGNSPAGLRDSDMPVLALLTWRWRRPAFKLSLGFSRQNKTYLEDQRSRKATCIQPCWRLNLRPQKWSPLLTLTCFFHAFPEPSPCRMFLL